MPHIWDIQAYSLFMEMRENEGSRVIFHYSNVDINLEKYHI